MEVNWFIAYPKIHRVWKEEVEWIFDWFVYLQEKIDWCNTSIRTINWDLQMWSRTQIIFRWWEKLKEFRWFQEHILQNKWVLDYLAKNPNHTIYWEWLVRHTIQYPLEYYNRFYLFDILDRDTNKFLDTKTVDSIATEYWIDKPQLFFEWFTNKEEALKYVWQNIRWVPWEWVVVKWEFKNKYWDCVYAKIIHDQFKEENSILFANHSKFDIEMKFVCLYITPERVKKIVNKIEQNENKKISITDTPRVLWMVMYDAFNEEMWWFSWKLFIDMWKLKRLWEKMTKNIFHTYLNTGKFASWFDAIQ